MVCVCPCRRRRGDRRRGDTHTKLFGNKPSWRARGGWSAVQVVREFQDEGELFLSEVSHAAALVVRDQEELLTQRRSGPRTRCAATPPGRHSLARERALGRAGGRLLSPTFWNFGMKWCMFCAVAMEMKPGLPCFCTSFHHRGDCQAFRDPIPTRHCCDTARQGPRRQRTDDRDDRRGQGSHARSLKQRRLAHAELLSEALEPEEPSRHGVQLDLLGGGLGQRPSTYTQMAASKNLVNEPHDAKETVLRPVGSPPARRPAAPCEAAAGLSGTAGRPTPLSTWPRAPRWLDCVGALFACPTLAVLDIVPYPASLNRRSISALAPPRPCRFSSCTAARCAAGRSRRRRRLPEHTMSFLRTALPLRHPKAGAGPLDLLSIAPAQQTARTRSSMSFASVVASWRARKAHHYRTGSGFMRACARGRWGVNSMRGALGTKLVSSASSASQSILRWAYRSQ